MHYYQHHIGDFIKATARLSDSQSMAYLRLLWMYYDSEKPLKAEAKLLAFQVGAPEPDVELILQSFFLLEEDGWHQKRCDKEIADYRAHLEKKSNAGRASAERRKNNSSTGVQQVFNDSSTNHKPLTTNQQPITKNHKPIDKAAPVARPLDVPVSVWDSFLQLRKTKKAPVTSAALEGIKREAEAAGWTLEEALQECCVRGWQGFKSDWVEKRTKGKSQDDALMKIRQDEKLSAPMPDKVREMLKIKRIA